jgi:hypothetical protein
MGRTTRAEAGAQKGCIVSAQVKSLLVDTDCPKKTQIFKQKVRNVFMQNLSELFSMMDWGFVYAVSACLTPDGCQDRICLLRRRDCRHYTAVVNLRLCNSGFASVNSSIIGIQAARRTM